MPEVLKSPAMSSFAAGLIVPKPKFPVESILTLVAMFPVSFVLKSIGDPAVCCDITPAVASIPILNFASLPTTIPELFAILSLLDEVDSWSALTKLAELTFVVPTIKLSAASAVP